jgi:hypothetical protein
MRKYFIGMAACGDGAGTGGSFGGETITLSGTVTVTHKGQLVPHVYINAGTASGDWLGSSELEYPGANAPWSISIQVLDPPADVQFWVVCFASNGNGISLGDYDVPPLRPGHGPGLPPNGVRHHIV